MIGFIPVNGLPYETNMQWNLPGTTSNLYPTARLDIHLTSKLNYSTTWNLYRWDIVGVSPYPARRCLRGIPTITLPNVDPLHLDAHIG